MDDERGLPVARIGIIDDDILWPFISPLFDEQLPLRPIPIQAFGSWKSIHATEPQFEDDVNQSSQKKETNEPLICETSAEYDGSEGTNTDSNTGKHIFFNKYFSLGRQFRGTDIAAILKPIGITQNYLNPFVPSLLPFRASASAAICAKVIYLLSCGRIFEIEAKGSQKSLGNATHLEFAYSATTNGDWKQAPERLAPAQVLISFGAKTNKALNELLCFHTSLERFLKLASVESHLIIKKAVRTKVKNFLQSSDIKISKLPEDLEWTLVEDELSGKPVSGFSDSALSMLQAIFDSPNVELWKELFQPSALRPFLSAVNKAIDMVRKVHNKETSLECSSENGNVSGVTAVDTEVISKLNTISRYLRQIRRNGGSKLLRKVLKVWEGVPILDKVIDQQTLSLWSKVPDKIPQESISYGPIPWKSISLSTSSAITYLDASDLDTGSGGSKWTADVSSINSGSKDGSKPQQNPSKEFQSFSPDAPIWLDPVIVEGKSVIQVSNQIFSSANAPSLPHSQYLAKPAQGKLEENDKSSIVDNLYRGAPSLDLLNPRFRMVQNLKDVPLALMLLVTCPDPDGYKDLRLRVKSIVDSINKLSEREHKLALSYARTLSAEKAKPIVSAVSFLTALPQSAAFGANSGDFNNLTGPAAYASATSIVSAAVAAASATPGSAESSSLVCPIPTDLVIVYVSLGRRTPPEFANQRNTIREGLSAFFSFVSSSPSPSPSPQSTNSLSPTPSNDASENNLHPLSDATSDSVQTLIPEVKQDEIDYKYGPMYRYDAATLAKLDKNDRKIMQKLSSDFPKSAILRLDPWSGRISRHSNPKMELSSTQNDDKSLNNFEESNLELGEVDDVHSASGFSHWRKLMEHMQVMISQAVSRRWRTFVSAQLQSLTMNRLPGWNISNFISVHEGLALLESQVGCYSFATNRYSELEAVCIDPCVANSSEILSSDFDSPVDIDLLLLSKNYSGTSAFANTQLCLWPRPVPYPTLFALPGCKLQHSSKLSKRLLQRIAREGRSLLIPELGIPERPFLPIDLELYLLEIIGRVRRHREETKRAVLSSLSRTGLSEARLASILASEEKSELGDHETLSAAAAALASVEENVPAELSSWAPPLFPLSPLLQVQVNSSGRKATGPCILELRRGLLARQSRLILFYSRQPLAFLERILVFLGGVMNDIQQGGNAVKILCSRRKSIHANNTKSLSLQHKNNWNSIALESVYRTLDLEDASIDVSESRRWWESQAYVEAWTDDSNMEGDDVSIENENVKGCESEEEKVIEQLRREVASIMSTGMLPVETVRISVLARAPRAATAWMIGAVLDALRIAEDCLTSIHRKELDLVVQSASEAIPSDAHTIVEDIKDETVSHSQNAMETNEAQRLQSDWIGAFIQKNSAENTSVFTKAPAELPSIHLDLVNPPKYSQSPSLMRTYISSKEMKTSRTMLEMKKVFEAFRRPSIGNNSLTKFGFDEDEEISGFAVNPLPVDTVSYQAAGSSKYRQRALSSAAEENSEVNQGFLDECVAVPPWLALNPVKELSELTWKELDEVAHEYPSLVRSHISRTMDGGEKKRRNSLGEMSDLTFADKHVRLKAQQESELRRMTELRSSALELAINAVANLICDHSFPKISRNNFAHDKQDELDNIISLQRKEERTAKAMQKVFLTNRDQYPWMSVFPKRKTDFFIQSEPGDCSKQGQVDDDVSQLDMFPFLPSHIIAPSTLEDTGLDDQVFEEQIYLERQNIKEAAAAASLTVLSPQNALSKKEIFASASQGFSVFEQRTKIDGSMVVHRDPDVPNLENDLLDVVFSGDNDNDNDNDNDDNHSDFTEGSNLSDTSSDDSLWEGDNIDVAMSYKRNENTAVGKHVEEIEVTRNRKLQQRLNQRKQLNLESLWRMDLAKPLCRSHDILNSQLGENSSTNKQRHDKIFSSLTYSQFSNASRNVEFRSINFSDSEKRSSSSKNSAYPLSTDAAMSGMRNATPRLTAEPMPPLPEMGLANLHNLRASSDTQSKRLRGIGTPPRLNISESTLPANSLLPQEPQTKHVVGPTKPSNLPLLARSDERRPRWLRNSCQTLSPGIVQGSDMAGRFIVGQLTNAWTISASARKRNALDLAANQHNSRRLSRSSKTTETTRGIGFGHGVSLLRSESSHRNFDDQIQSPRAAQITQSKRGHNTTLTPGSFRAPTTMHYGTVADTLPQTGCASLSRKRTCSISQNTPLEITFESDHDEAYCQLMKYNLQAYDKRLLKLRHSLFFASSSRLIMVSLLTRLKSAYDRLGRSRMCSNIGVVLDSLSENALLSNVISESKAEKESDKANNPYQSKAFQGHDTSIYVVNALKVLREVNMDNGIVCKTVKRKGWISLSAMYIHAASLVCGASQMLSQRETKDKCFDSVKSGKHTSEEAVLLLHLLSIAQSTREGTRFGYPMVRASEVLNSTIMDIMNHHIEPKLLFNQGALEEHLTDSYKEDLRPSSSICSFNPASHLKRLIRIIKSPEDSYLRTCMNLNWSILPHLTKSHVQKSLFYPLPFQCSKGMKEARMFEKVGVNTQKSQESHLKNLLRAIALSGPTVVVDINGGTREEEYLKLAKQICSNSCSTRHNLQVSFTNEKNDETKSSTNCHFSSIYQFEMETFWKLQSVQLNVNPYKVPLDVSVKMTVTKCNDMPVPVSKARIALFPRYVPCKDIEGLQLPLLFVRYNKYGCSFSTSLRKSDFSRDNDSQCVSSKNVVKALESAASYLLKGPELVIKSSWDSFKGASTNEGSVFNASLREVVKVPFVLTNQKFQWLVDGISRLCNCLMELLYLDTMCSSDATLRSKISALVSQGETMVFSKLSQGDPAVMIAECIEELPNEVQSIIWQYMRELFPYTPTCSLINYSHPKLVGMMNRNRHESDEEISTINLLHLLTVMVTIAAKYSETESESQTLIPPSLLLPPPILEFESSLTVTNDHRNLFNVDNQSSKDTEIALELLLCHRLQVWSKIDCLLNNATSELALENSCTKEYDVHTNPIESTASLMKVVPPLRPPPMLVNSRSERTFFRESQETEFPQENKTAYEREVVTNVGLNMRRQLESRAVSLQLSRLRSEDAALLLGLQLQQQRDIMVSYRSFTFDGRPCLPSESHCASNELDFANLGVWFELSDSIILRSLTSFMTCKKLTHLAPKSVEITPTVDATIVDSSLTGQAICVEQDASFSTPQISLPELWLPRTDPITIRITVRAGNVDLDCPFVRLDTSTGLAILSTSLTPRLISTLRSQHEHLCKVVPQSSIKGLNRVLNSVIGKGNSNDKVFREMGLVTDGPLGEMDPAVPSLSASLFHNSLQNCKPTSVSIVYHHGLSAFLLPFTLPSRCVLMFDVKIAIPGASTLANPIRLLLNDRQSASKPNVRQSFAGGVLGEAEEEMFETEFPNCAFITPSPVLVEESLRAQNQTVLKLPSLPSPRVPCWHSANYDSKDKPIDDAIGFIPSASASVIFSRPKTDFIICNHEIPRCDDSGYDGSYISEHRLSANLFAPELVKETDGCIKTANMSLMWTDITILRLKFGSPIWTSARIRQVGRRLLFNFVLRSFRLPDRYIGLGREEVVSQYTVHSIRLTTPRSCEVNEAGVPANPEVSFMIKGNDKEKLNTHLVENSIIASDLNQEISISRKSISMSGLDTSASFDSQNSLLNVSEPGAHQGILSSTKHRSFEKGLNILPGSSCSFTFAVLLPAQGVGSIDMYDPLSPTYSRSFDSSSSGSASKLGNKSDFAQATLRIQLAITPQLPAHIVATRVTSGLIRKLNTTLTKEGKEESSELGCDRASILLKRSMQMRDPSQRAPVLANIVYTFPLASVEAIGSSFQRTISTGVVPIIPKGMTMSPLQKSLPFSAYHSSAYMFYQQLKEHSLRIGQNLPKWSLLVSAVSTNRNLYSLSSALHDRLSQLSKARSFGEKHSLDVSGKDSNLRLRLQIDVVPSWSRNVSCEANLCEISRVLNGDNARVSFSRHSDGDGDKAASSNSDSSFRFGAIEWCPARFTFELCEDQWVCSPSSNFAVILIPSQTDHSSTRTNNAKEGEGTGGLRHSASVYLTLTPRSSKDELPHKLPNMRVTMTPLRKIANHAGENSEVRWEEDNDQSIVLKAPLIRFRSL